MKQVEVVIGIVLRGGRILICRRLQTAALPGVWEFPGGKLEPGESLVHCLTRELQEELAIHVRPIERLAMIDHAYAEVRVRLHPYLCEHVAGEPQPIACQEPTWVEPQRLPHYRFPAANDALISELVRRFAPSPGPTASPIC